MRKLTLVVLLLTVGAAMFAQEMTLSQLNQKVQELERRIQLLEKVIAMQTTQSDPAIIQVPADKKAWRQLKKGMSQDEVRNLLGEPAKVSVSGIFTHWSYSTGNLDFDYKDRLMSWSED